jgi:hypothetical protein
MTASTTIMIAATAVTASVLGVLEHRSRTNVVTVGFWFEDVTFELHDPARLGGPLTTEEQQRISLVARREIEHAFAGFRILLTDRREAFYRVQVRQVLGHRLRFPVAGQSNVFGLLGGSGAVSFLMLSAQAMAHAPPGAGRTEIVDAMGRGIGRAAVHEFVHQILPGTAIHATQDADSYEYWSSDRKAQYYGSMRWSIAHAPLLERLERR